MQKPVEKPIKFIKNLQTKGKSYPITHTEAVIDKNGNTLSQILDSGISGGGMTKTTWQELKDKRDAGELTPGSLYRITDYQCTTTQEATQSAGHQFDIVLLALSKDKLAEEGWAMKHESDTPTPEPTGTTYYKWTGYEQSTLIEVERWTTSPNPQYQDPVYDLHVESFHLTGSVLSVSEQEVVCGDERLYNLHLTTLTEETMFVPDEEEEIVDYFANSNLSAWKVWYCLDNDTARFAWADDSVDEGTPASITLIYNDISFIFTRSEENDRTVSQIDYYAWRTEENGGFTVFTSKLVPDVGDDVYSIGGRPIRVSVFSTVTAYTPPQEGGEPIGRGVIFRLIDEWNNDCPYDFKNIQFIRKLTGGAYDENEGTNTWCYTTGETALDIDLSIWHYPTHDLYISSFVDIGVEENTCKYFLPNNVFLIPTSSKLYDTTGCTMMGAPLEMRKCRNVILGDGVNAGVYINCFGMSDNNDERASFYFNNVEVISGMSGLGDSGDDTTSR